MKKERSNEDISEDRESLTLFESKRTTFPFRFKLVHEFKAKYVRDFDASDLIEAVLLEGLPFIKAIKSIVRLEESIPFLTSGTNQRKIRDCLTDDIYIEFTSCLNCLDYLPSAKHFRLRILSRFGKMTNCLS